jgi:hypothetical protein
MASSANAVPFENDDEFEGSENLDSTCPECATDSVATFIDRYSTYEYCTNCDWSDEDADEGGQRELIVRRDRGRSND